MVTRPVEGKHLEPLKLRIPEEKGIRSGERDEDRIVELTWAFPFPSDPVEQMTFGIEEPEFPAEAVHDEEGSIG